MEQVQRGTTNTIRVTFTDGDSVVTVDSATVQIVASDSSETLAATSAVADGDEWTFLLPPVAECDRLTATWTGLLGPDTYVQTTTIEVVGDFYFSIAALELIPDIVDSSGRYENYLVEGRQWVESAIETICRTSFVPRYREDVVERRAVVSPNGYPEIRLSDLYPRKLLSVSLDGTNLTPDELATLTVAGGVLGPVAAWTYTPVLTGAWVNATIRYVAYYSTEPTADLRSSSMQRARDHITSTYGGTETSTQISVEDDKTICNWRDRVRIPSIG